MGKALLCKAAGFGDELPRRWEKAQSMNSESRQLYKAPSLVESERGGGVKSVYRAGPPTGQGGDITATTRSRRHPKTLPGLLQTWKTLAYRPCIFSFIKHNQFSMLIGSLNNHNALISKFFNVRYSFLGAY